MAFLKRLSDGVWSYISPKKQDATPAPFSESAVRTRGRLRSGSEGIARRNRSTGNVQRLNGRRDGSNGRSQQVVAGQKRKMPPTTPSSLSGRTPKLLRREPEEHEEEDSDDYDEDDFDDDEALDVSMSGALPPSDEQDDQDDEEEQDDGDSEDDQSHIKQEHTRRRRTLSPGDDESFYDDIIEGDTSLVVSETAFDNPEPTTVTISPTTETFNRHLSTEELEAQGWESDHIVLVQKLGFRGHQPILPQFCKFRWYHMPDVLFCEDDESAFVGAVRGGVPNCAKALEALFELGGRVRDLALVGGRKTPEQATKKIVNDFIKWSHKDSGLDHETAIPLLALECKPPSVPASQLEANACKKLQKLAQRYRVAFSANPSIEAASDGGSEAELSYPIPTLYALIASGTIIALAAFNPDDEEPNVKMVAVFQMGQSGYDVWNALAIAMIVCHVRNVQLRLAYDTGLGVRDTSQPKVEVDDADL